MTVESALERLHAGDPKGALALLSEAGEHESPDASVLVARNGAARKPHRR
jgi:hypothetical protein